jgi:hypothetical protein
MREKIGMEAFAELARRELGATGETARKRTVDTSTELTARGRAEGGLTAAFATKFLAGLADLQLIGGYEPIDGAAALGTESEVTAAS